MSRTTDYTNAAQQRLLQLIDLLAGHELQGLAPAEIAKALNASPSVVTRDLDNLRTAGWGANAPGRPLAAQPTPHPDIPAPCRGPGHGTPGLRRHRAALQPHLTLTDPFKKTNNHDAPSTH